MSESNLQSYRLAFGSERPAADVSTVLIRPSSGWISFGLKELWAYRELLYFLVWRDVKVRYKQTAIGAAWAIVQPLMTMLIFLAVFRGLAKVPSDGIPYPIFTFTALLAWNLFSGALNRCTTSVVGQSNLISKVYFPRLIVPISATVSGVVDFAVAFMLLLGMMIWFGVYPSWALVALPFFLALALLTALAVGLWLSALNVRYRDVGHVIPFLIQLWMFASPVAYPVSLVPEKWRYFYSLNPVAGVIEGFRWTLLGKERPDLAVIALSTSAVIVILLGGIVYFKRTERTFVDEM